MSVENSIDVCSLPLVMTINTDFMMINRHTVEEMYLVFRLAIKNSFNLIKLEFIHNVYVSFFFNGKDSNCKL